MLLQLPVLEAQPEFPLVDLNERNAEALSLMMANQAVLTSLHEPGERLAWAYRVGHPASVKSSEKIYDGAPIAALSHGIMMFEAINAAIAAEAATKPNELVVNKTAVWLTSQAADAELSENMMKAVDVFRNDLPNTTDVIIDASRRFVGPLTEYALLGAALERDIVVSALSFKP